MKLQLHSDPPAMGFCACGTIPIVLSADEIVEGERIRQIWYEDDFAAGGELERICAWWGTLCQRRPGLCLVTSLRPVKPR